MRRDGEPGVYEEAIRRIQALIPKPYPPLNLVHKKWGLEVDEIDSDTFVKRPADM